MPQLQGKEGECVWGEVRLGEWSTAKGGGSRWGVSEHGGHKFHQLIISLPNLLCS